MDVDMDMNVNVIVQGNVKVQNDCCDYAEGRKTERKKERKNERERERARERESKLHIMYQRRNFSDGSLQYFETQ